MNDLSTLIVMDPLSIRNTYRDIGGRTIIDRVIASLSEIGQTIYIVGLDTSANLGRMQLLPGHTWAGHAHALRSGLTTAQTDWIFAVGGNWPFVNPGLVRFMMTRRAQADAVLVRSDRGLQSLHGLYHRRCLPLLDEAITCGVMDLTPLASQLHAQIVDVTLSPSPMDRLSVFEVQDNQDYRKAVQLADKLLEYEIPRETVVRASGR